MNRKKNSFLVKRVFDIIVAMCGVVILSPIIIICSILIKIKLGSPIFFRQERVGLNNKPFMMLKFRSMTDERDSEGNLLANEIRLTKFGKKLRDLSIDELPELFNVIKGDMSLIGPRPLPSRYLPLYDEVQIKRHNVLPGISGWAQVNGRNSISWDKRFELDVWYVENWSLLLDIKILFLTFTKVFKREGINQGNSIGRDAFKGCTEDNKNINI
ncbi:sugar transferase [Clostridium paraputrificum]|uniref:sugar transferase n=1 Tax=Clostridium paraputrificum TaxID=29363 RepID=UPI00325C2438